LGSTSVTKSRSWLIKTLHTHWYYGFPVALLLVFAAFVQTYSGESSATAPSGQCSTADGSACPSSSVSSAHSPNGVSKPAALPDDGSEVAHPDRLPDQTEQLQALNPDHAWQRRVDRLAQVTQDRLFASRFHGPYAISVLDRLNEMVIGTNLKAYGVSSDEAPLRLGNPVLSAIPSSMPAYGYISSAFGLRRSPFTGRRVQHNGLDIAVNYGSPIYATADGIVTLAGDRYAMGRTVVINHGFGIVTRYGHNSQVLVRAGEYVQKGQKIALSGSTGRSTGAHLHYEVWVNGEVVDPTKFMFDVPAAALQPATSLAADSIREQQAPFSLGFAAGGEAAESIRNRDWLAELSRQRQGLIVTTLLILSFFAVFCAGIVMAAGRGLRHDYSLRP
jgi:murein DD-endopeptidase MepM/ murein hydrolase activator NlpD